jgi:hypothetical protein
MAYGDFLDLAQHAARVAQYDVEDTDYDMPRAKEAVNEAYLSICHDGNAWEFLEQEGQWTTTAGSDVYDFDSIATAIGVSGATVREIKAITDDTNGGRPLAAQSWRQLESWTDSSQESTEGQGTPTHYSVWNSRVRLYPKPDQTYTLGFFGLITPNPMDDDTDEPLLPLAWRHRVLVPYAGALLLMQEGGGESFGGYDRLMSLHRNAFEQMRTALASRRTGFNVVSPTAFDHLPGSNDVW